jgi:hypothetical protein
VVLWWTAAVAWTWYALIGASVTAAVATVTSGRQLELRTPEPRNSGTPERP